MRPSTDEYFLSMARLVSTRGTCHRRKVGCVLVDARNRVLATGYNGVPSGVAHCNHVNADGLMPNLCSGAFSASGTNLSSCAATHAESNALISCRHPEDIVTAYVTSSPCLECTRFLLNTTCREIVFEELYPHPEALRLWKQQGRNWKQLEAGKPDQGVALGLS